MTSGPRELPCAHFNKKTGEDERQRVRLPAIAGVFPRTCRRCGALYLVDVKHAVDERMGGALVATLRRVKMAGSTTALATEASSEPDRIAPRERWQGRRVLLSGIAPPRRADLRESSTPNDPPMEPQ